MDPAAGGAHVLRATTKKQLLLLLLLLLCKTACMYDSVNTLSVSVQSMCLSGLGKCFSLRCPEP